MRTDEERLADAIKPLVPKAVGVLLGHQYGYLPVLVLGCAHRLKGGFQ